MSTRPHPRRRLSPPERRRQLLDAARQEFLLRGYGSARLEAVATACGVTEGLVYKYFDSKEELFDAAVISPLRERLASRIEEIRAVPVDPDAEAVLETTRRFIRTLLCTFNESAHDIGVALFGEPAHAQHFYARQIQPLVDTAVDACTAVANRWPRSGYDARIAMKAAFGMTFWLALENALGQADGELEATADQLADILVHGLKAR
jgi:AcrR family transcriptional regulator